MLLIGAAFAQSTPRHVATYLGGTDRDVVTAVAVAGNGDLVVAGHTKSIDFPVTPGALQTAPAGAEDVFVARLSSDGSQLLASTRLGGSALDVAEHLEVAGDGSIWVGGTTRSTDFPTTSDAFATGFGGRSDAFVANLDGSLTTLLYATTFGRVATDTGATFALDEANQRIYLAGTTGGGFSQSVPTTSTGFNTTLRNVDAYLAVLDRSVPNTTSLYYGTLLGGSGFEVEVQDVSIDANGVASVSGTTTSSDFPTTANALQASLSGSKAAFFVQVDPNATGNNSLSYATYLGGSNVESYLRHAQASNGVVHLLLVSNSPDLPVTANAMQPSPNSGNDVFYAQLVPGKPLQYGSWVAAGNKTDGVTVGNVANQDGAALAVAPGRVALWICTDSSSGLPVSSGAFQRFRGGGFHGYAAVLDIMVAGAPKLAYATHYVGCGGGVFSGDVAFDANGDLLLTGWSDDLPVTRGVSQSQSNGNLDGTITRLEPAPWPSAYRTFGAACAGSVGTPTLAGGATPRLCGTLTLDASGVAPGHLGALLLGPDDFWMGAPLPLSLSSAGAPGCFLHVGLAVVVSLPTGNGSVRFTTPVPAQLGLLGEEVYAQYAAFDAAANPLGVVTTNGVAAELRW